MASRFFDVVEKTTSTLHMIGTTNAYDLEVFEETEGDALWGKYSRARRSQTVDTVGIGF